MKICDKCKKSHATNIRVGKDWQENYCDACWDKAKHDLYLQNSLKRVK